MHHIKPSPARNSKISHSPARPINFINHPPKSLHHPAHILIQLLIPKPNHPKPTRPEPLTTPRIIDHRIRLQMVRPIQLHNQLVCKANKIDDIRPNRRLPTKLPPAQLLTPKKRPQPPLSIRRLITKHPGKLALLIITIHAQVFPPCLTLPASGREPE